MNGLDARRDLGSNFQAMFHELLPVNVLSTRGRAPRSFEARETLPQAVRHRGTHVLGSLPAPGRTTSTGARTLVAPGWGKCPASLRTSTVRADGHRGNQLIEGTSVVGEQPVLVLVQRGLGDLLDDVEPGRHHLPERGRAWCLVAYQAVAEDSGRLDHPEGHRQRSGANRGAIDWEAASGGLLGGAQRIGVDGRVAQRWQERVPVRQRPQLRSLGAAGLSLCGRRSMSWPSAVPTPMAHGRDQLIRGTSVGERWHGRAGSGGTRASLPAECSGISASRKCSQARSVASSGRCSRHTLLPIGRRPGPWSAGRSSSRPPRRRRTGRRRTATAPPQTSTVLGTSRFSFGLLDKGRVGPGSGAPCAHQPQDGWTGRMKLPDEVDVVVVGSGGAGLTAALAAAVAVQVSSCSRPPAGGDRPVRRAGVGAEQSPNGRYWRNG